MIKGEGPPVIKGEGPPVIKGESLRTIDNIITKSISCVNANQYVAL